MHPLCGSSNRNILITRLQWTVVTDHVLQSVKVEKKYLEKIEWRHQDGKLHTRNEPKT